jgi:hypothetical protein
LGGSGFLFKIIWENSEDDIAGPIFLLEQTKNLQNIIVET